MLEKPPGQDTPDDKGKKDKIDKGTKGMKESKGVYKSQSVGGAAEDRVWDHGEILGKTAFEFFFFFFLSLGDGLMPSTWVVEGTKVCQ